MNKLVLPDVTVVGVDTLTPERTLKALITCERYADFGAKVLITNIAAPLTTASGIRVVSCENKIASLDDYSHFMIKRLASFVHTRFALVVQYDGFILNPRAWTDEFLKYDYIGAPWLYDDNWNVGNGGFSLRSKRLLDFLQADEHVTEYHPEDHHICRTYGPYLVSLGFRFAPEALAKRFSLEGSIHATDPIGRGRVWTGEFGFHNLRRTDVRLWDDIEWFLNTRVTLPCQ